MSDLGRLRIEPIRRDRDRRDFDCGHPFLNEYLRQFARQNSDGGTARAYVAVPTEGKRVVGYYTLAAGAVGFQHLPTEWRRRLPQYPVPVARIGELAVDRRFQGQGLGGVLMLDAFERIAAASNEVAVWAVVVDPIDRAAADLYRRFGFESLMDSETLFLTLRDLADWLS